MRLFCVVSQDRRLGRWWSIETLPANRQIAAAHAVGQQSEMADAHEAGGDGMQQKTAQEFRSIELHRAGFVVVGVVFPFESDGLIVG